MYSSISPYFQLVNDHQLVKRKAKISVWKGEMIESILQAHGRPAWDPVSPWRHVADIFHARFLIKSRPTYILHT